MTFPAKPFVLSPVEAWTVWRGGCSDFPAHPSTSSGRTGKSLYPETGKLFV